MTENKSDERELEYQAMRGEYLSLMASLEHNLTFLLAEWLEPRHHWEEFEHWFARAPIPFGSKVDLFEQMVKDDTIINQFGYLPTIFRDAQNFRNVLAHSFRQLERTVTARGREIPEERVSYESLREKLEELRRFENFTLNLLGWAIEGPQPDLSIITDYAAYPEILSWND